LEIFCAPSEDMPHGMISKVYTIYNKYYPRAREKYSCVVTTKYCFVHFLVNTLVG
jgi:hypothetical protein